MYEFHFLVYMHSLEVLTLVALVVIEIADHLVLVMRSLVAGDYKYSVSEY